MCAGSTESWYVPFEVAKFLKERGYKADYMGGKEQAYDSQGNFIRVMSVKEAYNEEDLYPCIAWQDAFRWLRERWGIYAYVKRDTYHHKFRYVLERDHPQGETISRTYDTIDDARVALFLEVRDNRIKRILEDPKFFRYTYFSPEEEAEGKALQEERQKRWMINHLKKNPQDREDYFKSHPEHEEEYMREINEEEKEDNI